MDRFYVKRCFACQQFGHYKKDCTNHIRCGYCTSNAHGSSDCPIKDGDKFNFSCANCKDSNKDFNGHSSHWYNCPTYIEKQDRLKKNIPYYNSKN